MVLKKNLPFAAALACAAVLFIVVLIWLHGGVSARSKVRADVKSERTELEKLKKKDPTKEHLAAIKQQYEQAQTEYATLKERLLAWWDKDVYDEEKSSRQPGLFLGSLQQLRSQVIKLAEKQGVWLGTGVENLGFPELAQGTPPAEVTFDMLKQRSIVRDIFMLLLHNKVESIDAINWFGPEQGGSLYSKYRVSIVFTCKYPSLAKFQTDLVKKAKVPVDIYGDFPRNFLVVEDLSYEAQDLKVAALEQGGSTGSEGRTTRPPGATIRPPGSTTTRPPGATIRPPGGTRTARSNLDHLPANVREAILRREALARGPAVYTRPGSRQRQPGGTAEAARARREQDKPTVGREPNYNILTVTMTISMVDFREEITGKIPALEEEKKKPKSKEKSTTTASSQR